MDPIQTIKNELTKRKLKQKDLIGIIGDKATVSKIMNKKRHLTIDMVRNLSNKFKLDVDLLVQDYKINE